MPQPTSSSVLSPFAPVFKNVPEPPEEPTTEDAALIENPSQEMLEIPPHSPIPDLPSNNFGNSALADGGPVDTPAPAADVTESLQDQGGAERVESVEPDNTLSSSSVEHPSESDTARPQRVRQPPPRLAYFMPGNPVYCDQNFAQVQNIGTDYYANNYRAFGQPTLRNQFGLPPLNFPVYNYHPYLPTTTISGNTTLLSTSITLYAYASISTSTIYITAKLDLMLLETCICDSLTSEFMAVRNHYAEPTYLIDIFRYYTVITTFKEEEPIRTVAHTLFYFVLFIYSIFLLRIYILHIYFDTQLR